MRILWAVNLIPANVSAAMGLSNEVLGGWVEAMSTELCKKKDVQLAIACKCETDFDVINDNIRYFSINYNESRTLSDMEKSCLKIINSFKPDVIHIEGTEFLHSLAMLNVSKKINISTVVSMQGILNGYYNYQCGNLQIDDMMISKSLTNIFASWLLHLRKTKWFKPRMKNEQKTIEKADYILGRTSWDRAHSYAINPQAKYYSCSRNLRKPFYEVNWNINNIERHSLYVGNGYNALKGLHFVVEAVAQLKNEYPDIKVYVAGYKPYEDNDKRSFIKKGYGIYLRKLIFDLGVQDNFIFTGPLGPEAVADRLSKVNGYVLCSAIENSPNTLGEAMLVGTPCISAYVGGVSDMATDGVEALFYRNDDPKLLAWNIKKIFDNDDLCLKLSANGKKRALITHDTKRNADILLGVYSEIFENK